MYKSLIYSNAKIYYPHSNTYTPNLSKGNIILINSTTHSLLISLTSLLLINQFSDNSLNVSLVFFSDSLSTPLLILTMLLLSLILIASEHHLSKENLTPKKLYITILTLLQLFLIITFWSGLLQCSLFSYQGLEAKIPELRIWNPLSHLPVTP